MEYGIKRMREMERIILDRCERICAGARCEDQPRDALASRRTFPIQFIPPRAQLFAGEAQSAESVDP
jgi:hypothetical protein